MQHRRFIGNALVPGIVVALALAGCSSKDGPTPGAPGSTTVTIGDTEPDALTPARSFSSGWSEAAALFAPLAEVAPDGKLSYIQAESITPSNGNKTWTIKLRPGWTFHNGEPVTAKSYVDTWNYVAYGPNKMAASYTLSGVAGYPLLQSVDGAEPKAKTLSGLKVVDDTTFQVELSGPNSQFGVSLAGNQKGKYPMPQAAYQDMDAYNLAPIGNGAFQMDGKWEHNKEIKVKAYPDYKGEKPKITNITFRIYSTLDTAYTDVQAGNLDIVRAPQAKLPELETAFGKDHVLPVSANAPILLAFPPDDARFKDKRVREAFSHAIDREGISKAIYGGYFKPVTGIIPPAAVGGMPDDCQGLCSLDPAKAKQLLDQAGGFKGPLELNYVAQSGYDPLVNALANQIRQNLGIEVKLRTAPQWSDLFGPMAGGKFPAGPWITEWGILSPTADDILPNIWVPAGGGYSLMGRFSTPEIVAKINQGRAAATPEAALQAYHDADKLFFEAFPSVPLNTSGYVYVSGKRVTHLEQGNSNQIKYRTLTVG